METNPPAHSRGRELTQTAVEAIVNLVPAVGSTIAVLLMAGLVHFAERSCCQHRPGLDSHVACMCVMFRTVDEEASGAVHSLN
ncbi:hypothetical protein [Nonomuraea turcica]|uniref:hypothetical protein n=1 Tax=Nonomuraea sp. G32 TaxID=3067274 RepID=UPI00273BB37F|nr:hypothetical protein [Nonomuraea sp. G32]MDP4504035.1 hypothetical protein [Nonomuraea sp. G32]